MFLRLSKQALGVNRFGISFILNLTCLLSVTTFFCYTKFLQNYRWESVYPFFFLLIYLFIYFFLYLNILPCHMHHKVCSINSIFNTKTRSHRKIFWWQLMSKCYENTKNNVYWWQPTYSGTHAYDKISIFMKQSSITFNLLNWSQLTIYRQV